MNKKGKITILIISLVIIITLTGTSIFAYDSMRMHYGWSSYWDWEYEPNFRTAQILDALTFVNEASSAESNSDFRPSLQGRLENLNELNLADIKEYRNMEEDVINREMVNVIETDSDYGQKLKYLIERNMVSRDVIYASTSKGSSILKDYDSYTYQDETSAKYSGKDFKKPEDLKGARNNEKKTNK